MESPGFKVDRWFWVSVSFAILVVEGLGRGLTFRLVRIERLYNLWVDGKLYSSSWDVLLIHLIGENADWSFDVYNPRFSKTI